MARKSRKPESAAETLDQLESVGDRLAAWVGDNPYIILSVLAGILVIAGIIGAVVSSSRSEQDDASAALAEAQAEYRLAMGATEADLEIPEPANPETARRVRTRYIERFDAVADEYSGTPVAALAAMQVATLREALGEYESAIERLELALPGIDPTLPLSALLLQQLGGLYEARGDWAEAGSAYERAGGVAHYPLRFDALADAARCYAEAGDIDKAIATFDRIEAESPEARVPEHISIRLRELRAARQSG